MEVFITQATENMNIITTQLLPIGACDKFIRSTHVCIIHGGVNCLNSVPYRCYTYV